MGQTVGRTDHARVLCQQCQQSQLVQRIYIAGTAAADGLHERRGSADTMKVDTESLYLSLRPKSQTLVYQKSET